MDERIKSGEEEKKDKNSQSKDTPVPDWLSNKNLVAWVVTALIFVTGALIKKCVCEAEPEKHANKYPFNQTTRD